MFVEGPALVPGDGKGVRALQGLPKSFQALVRLDAFGTELAVKVLAVRGWCWVGDSADARQAAAALGRACELIRFGFHGLEEPAVAQFDLAAIEGSD